MKILGQDAQGEHEQENNEERRSLEGSPAHNLYAIEFDFICTMPRSCNFMNPRSNRRIWIAVTWSLSPPYLLSWPHSPATNGLTFLRPSPRLPVRQAPAAAVHVPAVVPLTYHHPTHSPHLPRTVPHCSQTMGMGSTNHHPAPHKHSRRVPRFAQSIQDNRMDIQDCLLVCQMGDHTCGSISRHGLVHGESKPIRHCHFEPWQSPYGDCAPNQ